MAVRENRRETAESLQQQHADHQREAERQFSADGAQPKHADVLVGGWRVSRAETRLILVSRHCSRVKPRLPLVPQRDPLGATWFVLFLRKVESDSRPNLTSVQLMPRR